MPFRAARPACRLLLGACGWLFVLLWWALLIAAAAPAAVAIAAEAQPTVEEVRVGVHPDRTRIVLDVTGPAAFRVQVLHDPERLVVDLPGVGWRARDPRPPSKGNDLIAGFREGQFQPGVHRLVADLRNPVVVIQTLRLPPNRDGVHRLVIDIARRPTPPPQQHVAAAEEGRPAAAADLPRQAATTDGRAGLPAVTPAVPSPEPAPLPPVAEPPAPKLKPEPAARPEPAKPVIVLDPGHGGRDVGAVGVTGTYEKDVALAVAEELRRRLLATGKYEVVSTRTEDRYVGLRERLKVAREANAHAFLSLHADSLEDNSLRGASVYTLSDRASDKEAEALARQHDKAAILNGLDLSSHDPEVQRILIDLAQRDTNNRSIDLASLIVTELGQVTSMLRRDRRHGGFVVLKSPDVPSVLVELGFMSNSVDEASLRDRGHRDKLAGAIMRALDHYFFGDASS